MKKNGLKRISSDKFYTCKEVVNLCLDFIEENIQINKKDTIIEPSAGNGAFSKALSKKYPNVISYDLYPEHESIIKQDYLTLNTSELEGKIHVIGNPPFGRQSSLAKKFIKKSCEFCHSVSFILPKSFKKNSFSKTFPLYFHLIASFDLPKDSFTIDGVKYDVPCVFQVWQKKNINRILPKYIIPTYYSYVKKDDSPDVCIRRVGVYAGAIFTDFVDKSIQSHYFIKLDNVDVDEFIRFYSEYVVFDFDNTVGPKSISKQELNMELNMWLNMLYD